MMTRTAFTGLIWIGSIAAALADQAPVRVAVISDADNQNLAALVTTELSSSPDISLVERDDLAKVGDELKLRQMARSDAVTLGKLVGADGLLLLDKRVDGTHVRLTAVNLGYALFEEVVSEKTETVRQAQAIADATRAYLPKLKLQSSAALPIAVLNLRADYATPATLELERNLTLLLESGLASVPGFVVLERRHAWSLGFERSLETPVNPLLDGAWLLDGTITLAATDSGEVTVHLRLRPPHGTERTGDIQGSAQDLPALVKKVVGQVQEFTGKEMAHDEWHPEKEAREYLLEGIWGYQHKVYGAALEALDSAELLGETAPQLFAVRSEVCGAISGNDLNIENGRIILPNGPWAQPPETRADMIIRAIEDAVRFNGAIKAPGYIPDSEFAKAWTYPNPAPNAVSYASYILVLLDRDAPAQSDRVRQALRALTKFDPDHGVMGPYHMLGYAYTQDLFVEEWPATLDEELAALRVLCSNSKDWLPSVVLEQGKDFCPRFLKTPEKQKKQFDLFVRSLKDMPFARARKLLIQSASSDPGEADAAYRAYLGELWNQRDTLAQAHGFPADLACARDLPDEVRRRNAAAGLPLLHYVLDHSDSFLPCDIVLTILWQPAGWSRDEAASIWKEYLAYKVRAGSNLSVTAGRDYEEPFARQFPDLAVGPSKQPELPPTQSSLVVTRFWYPKDTTKRLMFTNGAFVPAIDGLWVVGELDGIPELGGLYHINLDTFQTVAVTRAQAAYPGDMLVTKDAVYLICLTSDAPQKTVIERYDLARKTWDEHEMPVASIYEVAGQLYLSLEGGIARYNPTTGGITTLASSRRRPAQNQFDDRTSYGVFNIFAGPLGKPCAMIDMGNITTESYYINAQSGPWLPLTRFGFLFHAQTDGVRTLLYGRGSRSKNPDIAVMFDPAKDEPELWLGNPTPLPMVGLPGSPLALRPELPAWAQKPIWPVADENDTDEYGFRGDDLFALARHDQTAELIWYRRGQAEPVRIALSFKMDQATDTALRALLPDEIAGIEQPKDIHDLSMEVTSQGICFTPGEEGFWYLPFADIDAYAKDHPDSQSDSAPPPGTAIHVPRTSTSLMETDGFDPGDASSFP